MPENYLDKIWEYKQLELEAQMRQRPLVDLKAQARDTEAPRDFFGAVTEAAAHANAIIAEIKQASPSLGVIVDDFDPVRIANQYMESGAAALSVLTDEHFFMGHPDHIAQVKQAVSLPVLRKDFTLHEYQIIEARFLQADAVLLIARMLEKNQLLEYLAMVLESGMTPFLEVHDESDIEKLEPEMSDAKNERVLVGINNRDLSHFNTDIETSLRLKKIIPEEMPVVSESGIASREDVNRLNEVGISIFLVGESVLKSEDMVSKMRELRGD